MTRRLTWLFPLSLFVAWSFDFLFWGKAWGISFPLFVWLALGAGLLLANRQGLRPAGNAYWLLACIALFSLLSILRLEPMTLFLSRIATLFCMALLAASFLGGRWPEYSLSDHLAKLVGLVPYGLGGHQRHLKESRQEGEGTDSWWRRAAPIVRGAFFALPILVVLGALLSSADAIFADWLGELLDFLNLENLAEYLWRTFVIILLANLLAGIYFYALHLSQDKRLLGEDKPLVAPFLGFGETATVLVSVELMFLAFVAVQFRYFFGGEANVNAAGYTYAEYARAGFMELVAVAVISLLLFILLSSISLRKDDRQRRWFSGLGIALMALVSVMLVSAYQRLLLYESAYGFTNIRTYAHTFMIWLGALLMAVVVLEVLQRRRAFALAILIAGLGFVASLGLLNVDRFIAGANLERANQGYELDTSYLGWLSEDAVPALAEAFRRAVTEGDEELAAQLAQALACHAAQHDDYVAPEAWQAWHLSRSQARQTWEDIQGDPDFQDLDLQTHGSLRNGFYLRLEGEGIECGYRNSFD